MALGAALLLSLVPTVANASPAVDSEIRSELKRDREAFSSFVQGFGKRKPQTRGDWVDLSAFLRTWSARFGQCAGRWKALARRSLSPRLVEVTKGAGSACAQAAVASGKAAGAIGAGDSDAFTRELEQVGEARATFGHAIDAFNSYLGSQTLLDRLPKWASMPLRAGLYGAVAFGLLALYLLASGGALERSSRKQVSQVLRRKSSARSLLQSSTPALYPINLVTLVVVGYFLLPFCSVLGADFGLIGGFLILQMPRIPVMLLAAVFVVSVLTVFAPLGALFSRPKGGEIGFDLTQDQQHRVWSVSRDVAAKAGTRAADKIVVSAFPGIHVQEVGSVAAFLFGRQRRILTLGAPSIQGLAVGEVEAVLAHEYGHFARHDTAWSALTFRAWHVSGQAISRISAASRRGGWFAAVSRANPALWALVGYRMLFIALTSSYSRLGEFAADERAVALYGAPAFCRGLQKVVVNDAAFYRVYFPKMIELASEGKYLVNLFSAIEETPLEPTYAEALWEEQTCQAPARGDSHPPLKQRLDYAKAVDHSSPESEGSSGAFTALIEDWNDLSENLSNLLTELANHRAAAFKAQRAAKN